MVNATLRHGLVPECWKDTIIHPVPKVANSTKLEQFRPINTLPVMKKLVEQVVKEQLVEFIERKKILGKEQSGFRRKHSCETLLNEIITSWRCGLDKAKLIGVVFIDFKRAFETINRKLLINKLNQYGIGGQVLNWCKSYLQNRTQQTNVNGVVSQKLNNEEGVPQGSKLGPLLFILYINDVINVIKTSGCECRLFADDLIIYKIGKTTDEIECSLNVCLAMLNEWMNLNSLIINLKKSVFMLIHECKRPISYNIKIMFNGAQITEVAKTKYLGIVIDKHMKFDDYAYEIIRKASHKVQWLGRTKHALGNFAKLTLYKSMIAAQFEYCGTILINLKKKYLNKLQIVQNRAMRIILNVNKYTRIRDMLEALGFMTIEQRLKYNVGIFMHKMIHDKLPVQLCDLALFKTQHYQLRRPGELRVCMSRTKSAEKCITYYGFSLWNKMTEDVRKERGLSHFKRKLKLEIQNGNI